MRAAGSDMTAHNEEHHRCCRVLGQGAEGGAGCQRQEVT